MKANDMVQVEEANNEGERIVYDCKLVVKGTPSEVREAVIRTDILLSEADRTLTEIVLNTPRNAKSSQNVVSDDVLDRPWVACASIRIASDHFIMYFTVFDIILSVSWESIDRSEHHPSRSKYCDD